MWNVLGKIGLLAGLTVFAAEAVTTANCNLSGTLCQYAVFGPDERGIIRQNVEALQAEPSKSFSLRIDERRFLLGGRIDVYADSVKGSNVISAFPIETVQAYEADSEGRWAVFFVTSEREKVRPDNWLPLDIVLLVSEPAFAKRRFFLECRAYKASPSLRVLNVIYDQETRTLSFDVDGHCEHLVATGDRAVFFENGGTSGRVVFKFNEKLIVSEVEAVSRYPKSTWSEYDPEVSKKNLASFEEADKRMEACLSEIRNSTSTGTTSFAYCKDTAVLENTGDAFYFTAVGRHSKKEQLVEAVCNGGRDIIDEPLLAQFVCIDRSYGKEPSTQIDVQGAQFGGVQYDFYLYCKCSGFNVAEPRYNPANNSVEFELSSNKNEFVLNSIKIKLDGVEGEDDGPGLPRGKFRVRLSSAGTALALEPVT